MELTHFDAIQLEYLVSKAHNEDKPRAFGGLISADKFEKYPLWAAIIGLAPFYKYDDDAVAVFMDKYLTVFEYPDENSNVTFNEYYNELHALIEKLSKR